MIEQFIDSADGAERDGARANARAGNGARVRTDAEAVAHAMRFVKNDPQLRRAAYEYGLAQRQAKDAAEAEMASTREKRARAFWERAGGRPKVAEEPQPVVRVLDLDAAEAFIASHPPADRATDAPTLAECERRVRAERQRLKAVRRIFRELGIK